MTRGGIKIGVLGLGSIGLRHAKNLLDMGHSVSAYDPDPQRSALFQESGGQALQSKQDLALFADAIVIASPSAFHLDDLEWAVEKNKHVFVEKPLSHTLGGMDGILADASQKNITVCVGMNMRFNPAIKQLSMMIAEGALGDLLWANYWHSSYLPEWRPHADYKSGYAADPKTGGVIFDVIHGYDLLYFLLGDYNVRGASARSSGILDIGSDDCADILCQHKSGVSSTLHMDFITRPKTHTFTLAGTKAIARIDITKRHLSVTSSNGTVVLDKVFETDVNDDYRRELDDFINAIQSTVSQGCSLSDGISILEKVISSRRMAGLPDGA